FVSPSSTSILSTGRPVLSLTICARIVYVPMPGSCAAQLTVALPSSFNITVAWHPPLHAPHDAAATPQPSTRSPRRIEPTAGVRFDHPNFSEPTCRHSFKCRDENGFPLLSSVNVSFFSRSSTGSILSLIASSSIADSTANRPGTAPGPRIGHG